MAVTFLQLGSLGRLGNQMWQIAAVIGQATRCSQEYIFPPWRYSDSFLNHLPIGIINPKNQYNEQAFKHNKIRCEDDLDLIGYFQSVKYWEHCQDLIRKTFTPVYSVDEWVIDKIPEGITTGIHIRRTDYTTMGHYYHNLELQDYYQRALNQIENTGYVIIVSDDIPWCKDHFQADYYSTGNEIQDIFLLSRCTNKIISNSSFSWWSAYLGGGNVTAPLNWFMPVANHDTKDLYLPDWKLL